MQYHAPHKTLRSALLKKCLFCFVMLATAAWAWAICTRCLHCASVCIVVLPCAYRHSCLKACRAYQHLSVIVFSHVADRHTCYIAMSTMHSCLLHVHWSASLFGQTSTRQALTGQFTCRMTHACPALLFQLLHTRIIKNYVSHKAILTVHPQRNCQRCAPNIHTVSS